MRDGPYRLIFLSLVVRKFGCRPLCLGVVLWWVLVPLPGLWAGVWFGFARNVGVSPDRLAT